MSILYFLLMVGVLVLIHELGHFIAAKAFGVRVTTFSLGFGRRVAGFRLGETDYRLSWLPLGGYVRILGEDPGQNVTAEDRARAFPNQALWKRVTIILAGPIANFLLAAGIYFSFYASHTHMRAPTIGAVFSGQPAALGGLEPGDMVLSIDGNRVSYWDQVEQAIGENRGRTLRFRVRRGSSELERFVTPRAHILRDRLGRHKEVGWIGISQQSFLPQIGVIDRKSPAGTAGLETGDVITAINNRDVFTWPEAERLLRTRDGASINVSYLRTTRARWGFADVRTYRAGVATVWPEPRVVVGNKLAYDTGIASAELFVADVEPGTPAERIGLLAGDRVTHLDGRPISHWFLLEDALLALPDKEFLLEWETAGGLPMRQRFTQQTRRERDEYKQDQERLVFGAANDFQPASPELMPIQGRLPYAAGRAFRHTGKTIVAMVTGIAALLTGEAPSESVGGPVMLFHLTNVSAEKGFDSFMLMMALISINLGLLNLVPLPQLDGGQLVQTLLHAVRRQQLSPRTREAVATVGLLLILSLVVLALRNDIVRYVIR